MDKKFKKDEIELHRKRRPEEYGAYPCVVIPMPWGWGNAWKKKQEEEMDKSGDDEPVMWRKHHKPPKKAGTGDVQVTFKNSEDHNINTDDSDNERLRKFHWHFTAVQKARVWMVSSIYTWNFPPLQSRGGGSFGNWAIRLLWGTTILSGLWCMCQYIKRSDGIRWDPEEHLTTWEYKPSVGLLGFGPWHGRYLKDSMVNGSQMQCTWPTTRHNI